MRESRSGRRPGNHRRVQSGISLIELMIALVLGLIVISAVVNVYVGTNRSSSFSAGLRNMQENGRHGIAALQRGIRLAGYSPTSRIQPLDFAAGSDSSIVVRTTATQDCNGQSTTAVGGLAVNTYALDAANNRITCRGNSAVATAMPLIEGVDGFRVLYGVDSDEDGIADSYVSYDPAIDPNSVRGIRFALLVNSLQPIRTRPVSETHVLLDQEVDTNDRVSRHVFSTTVVLRNAR